MVLSPSIAPPLPLRVLLCEGNPQMLELLSTPVGHCGHEVRTSSRGDDALSIAEGFQPDVIFTSIVLGVRSGFDLVKNLRLLPQFSGTVIVALTGHAASMTLDEWHHAGFDKLLRKPADIDEIVDDMRIASEKGHPRQCLVGL